MPAPGRQGVGSRVGGRLAKITEVVKNLELNILAIAAASRDQMTARSEIRLADHRTDDETSTTNLVTQLRSLQLDDNRAWRMSRSSRTFTSARQQRSAN